MSYQSPARATCRRACAAEPLDEPARPIRVVPLREVLPDQRQSLPGIEVESHAHGRGGPDGLLLKNVTRPWPLSAHLVVLRHLPGRRPPARPAAVPAARAARRSLMSEPNRLSPATTTMSPSSPSPSSAKPMSPIAPSRSSSLAVPSSRTLTRSFPPPIPRTGARTSHWLRRSPRRSRRSRGRARARDRASGGRRRPAAPSADRGSTGTAAWHIPPRGRSLSHDHRSGEGLRIRRAMSTRFGHDRGDQLGRRDVERRVAGREAGTRARRVALLDRDRTPVRRCEIERRARRDDVEDVVGRARTANPYVPTLFAVSPLAAIRSAPVRMASTSPEPSVHRQRRRRPRRRECRAPPTPMPSGERPGGAVSSPPPRRARPGPYPRLRTPSALP